MKQTILVVEDERSLGAAIEDRLIKNGFLVLRADREEAALRILQNTDNISALWLDHYLLGQKTGLDFLHEIRGNEDWNDIPIFVVTNSVSDEKVSRYEILGIEKYYVKSDSSLTDIINSIKKTISKK